MKLCQINNVGFGLSGQWRAARVGRTWGHHLMWTNDLRCHRRFKNCTFRASARAHLAEILHRNLQDSRQHHSSSAETSTGDERRVSPSCRHLVHSICSGASYTVNSTYSELNRSSECQVLGPFFRQTRLRAFTEPWSFCMCPLGDLEKHRFWPGWNSLIRKCHFNPFSTVLVLMLAHHSFKMFCAVDFPTGFMMPAWSHLNFKSQIPSWGRLQGARLRMIFKFGSLVPHSPLDMQRRTSQWVLQGVPHSWTLMHYLHEILAMSFVAALVNKAAAGLQQICWFKPTQRPILNGQYFPLLSSLSSSCFSCNHWTTFFENCTGISETL